MKTRRVPLIIGLILALGTGALLLGYLTSVRPTGTVGQTKPVLVAIHDIPARAAATTDLFAVEQRIATQVDPDAISDPKALAGTYTLVPIPAGGLATTSKIGTASAATLPARLAVGMRAVTIAIDNVKGIAGLITPGDRVDVIAVPPHADNQAPLGSTIMRGVVVLAMGDNVQTTTAVPGPLSGPAVLSTITLEVTPNQADLLAGADIDTTLRLALRNPKEPVDAFPAETLTLAPQNAAPAGTPAPATTSADTTPQVQPAQHGVIVIDGDHVTSGNTGPG